MTKVESGQSADRHPRRLSIEKLSKQFANYRTVDGRRDRGLIGTKKEKGVVRELEAKLREELPEEFIGIAPFGSRAMGYALPVSEECAVHPDKMSDYDFIIAYDQSGDSFANAGMIRKITDITENYFENHWSGVGTIPRFSFIAVNLNPESVNKTLSVFIKKPENELKPNEIKGFRSLCRAVFGAMPGVHIREYRSSVAELIKRLVPDETSRYALIKKASCLIIESELHPNSADKLVRRSSGIGAEDIAEIKFSRQTLWERRLSKYLI